MKNIYLILAVVCFAFLATYSCKPKVDPEAQEIINDPNAEIHSEDPPSDAQVEFLDKLKSPEVDFDNIILPNGMTIKEFDRKYPSSGNGRMEGDETLNGPQRRKNAIIRSMLGEAQKLMRRSDFVKKEGEGGVPDCKNCPAQPNGIAYAFGSKDYTVRKNPEGYVYEEVFGLDCSGFVYQSAKKSIKNFTALGTSQQRLTSSWNDALRVEKENVKVLAKDLGKIEELKLKAGDIVYWGGHIAIVGVGGENSKAVLFQSNGSSAVSCGNPIKTEAAKECVKRQQEGNRGPNRGPRTLSFKEATTGKDWFGDDYKVIRLITDISGEWQLLGKCIDRTSDAIDMRIKIDPEKDNEVLLPIRKVSAQGVATDYDGKTIVRLVLDGEYDKEKNILKANITLSFDGYPEETRIDGFERPLNTDDTSYFPASSILSNGACSIAWRLINKSSNGTAGGRQAYNKIIDYSLFSRRHM